MGQIMKTKTGRRIQWLVLLAYPFWCFFIAELTMDIGKDIMPHGVFVYLFNYLWYLMIELTVWAVFRSVWAAITVITLFTAVFSAANIYLMQFRSIPLYLTDLTVIQTALNVAGNYSFKPTRGIWILIVFVFFGCLLGWLIRGKRRKVRVWHYVVTMAAVLAALGGLYWFTVYSAYMNKRVAFRNGFNPTSRYVEHGGLLVLMRSAVFLHLEEPEGYSEKAVWQLEQDLEEKLPEAAVPSEQKLPNILVIMDEAFADLQAIGDFETNEDVLPFYHALTDNTVKGLAYVSVFGGDTANSEYEFLTGDSMAFLPAHSSPFQTFIKTPMDSLVSKLKGLGYQGMTAMHPYHRKGYNRTAAYERLGFERFCSEEEFADETRLVREYVSDEADFDWLIHAFEEAKGLSDAPVFLYNVTMQNHGPYGQAFDNLPDTIQITSDHVKVKEKAQRYLNLARLTDDAIAKLIGYFSEVEEPTVIVLFGDHQPGLAADFYQSVTGSDRTQAEGETAMKYYRVPYLIWSNFDSPAEIDNEISLNFLQTKMLERFGLPLSSYDRFHVDLRNTFPIITAQGSYDAQGQFYEAGSKKLTSQNDYQAYSWLSFYHLFGAKGTDRFYQTAG